MTPENQTDLFEMPAYMRARRNNPATSKAAAVRVKEFEEEHHAQIMAALKNHRGGMTVHEIAAFCKIDAHAVGKRMKKLEMDCKVALVIVSDGDTPDGYTVLTRKTPSGRSARVWGWV